MRIQVHRAIRITRIYRTIIQNPCFRIKTIRYVSSKKNPGTESYISHSKSSTSLSSPSASSITVVVFIMEERSSSFSPRGILLQLLGVLKRQIDKFGASSYQRVLATLILTFVGWRLYAFEAELHAYFLVHPRLPIAHSKSYSDLSRSLEGCQ